MARGEARGDSYKLLYSPGRANRKRYCATVFLVIGVLVLIAAAFGLGLDAGYFLSRSTTCNSGTSHVTPSVIGPTLSPTPSPHTSNQTQLEWGSLLYDSQGKLVSVYDEVDGLMKAERIRDALK